MKMVFFLDIDIQLLIDMIKEELRLHRSLVGGLGSAFFPFIIFFLLGEHNKSPWKGQAHYLAFMNTCQI